MSVCWAMWTVARPALVSTKLLLVAWYCAHMHSLRQLLLERSSSWVNSGSCMSFVLRLQQRNVLLMCSMLCCAAVAALSTTLSTAALDKHPQSKERGITLDLGFSAFIVSVKNPNWVLTHSMHAHGVKQCWCTILDPTPSTPSM